MSSPNNNTISALNETAEEGEITEDVDLEGQLAYDSVSSNSFSASNVSNPKGSPSLNREQTSSFTFINEKPVPRDSRSNSKEERGVNINQSDTKKLHKSWRKKRRSKTSSFENSNFPKDNIGINSLTETYDNPVLRRTKVSSVISELNAAKAGDVILLSDEDHRTHGFVQTQKSSTLEKENSYCRLRSKSSDKEREISRRKSKHKKHSSRNSSEYHSHDSSTSRRKSREDKFSKYGREKLYKRHVRNDSDGDNHGVDSTRHFPHSLSSRKKYVDHTCRSFVKDSFQKRHSTKIPSRDPHVMSSEDLSRFKDNILMRKLLESGTIRSRRESGGSDLNCEIGSISSISSPEFGLFEDLHIIDEDSLESIKSMKVKIANEIKEDIKVSDDSEIEVIIPVRKEPELIELKSDSESETVKLHDELNNEQSNQFPDKKNEINVDQNETSECVNLNSPSPLPTEVVEIVENSPINNDRIVKNVEAKNEPDRVSFQNIHVRNENEKLSQTTMTSNEIDDEDDLQLRLAALRSAVMKKHLDRLQKRNALNSEIDARSQKDKKLQVAACEVNPKIDSKATDCPEQDKSFPRENIFCPSNKSSPYSPASSYSLSIGGENDNNVGEQDMEIAATDEDEACIEEQNIHVSPYLEYHDEREQLYSEDGKSAKHIRSHEFTSQILAMDINSSEATLDSLGPIKYDNCNEVPPQPLPPGVDLSNLPPEFSHSLFSADENINNINAKDKVDSTFCDDRNSLKADCGCKNDLEPKYCGSVQSPVHHNLESQDQLSLVGDKYFSDSLNVYKDLEINKSDYQELSANEVTESVDCMKITDNLPKETCDVSMTSLSGSNLKNVELNKEGYEKVSGVYECGDSRQDYSHYDTSSRSSFLSENLKGAKERVNVTNESNSIENEVKAATEQNDFSLTKTSTFSEKSQDFLSEKLDKDDDDENILRANLLSALGCARVDKNVSGNGKKVTDKTKLNKVISKNILRKRHVVSRSGKKSAVVSSLSDQGFVSNTQFNLKRKKNKNSFLITAPVSDNNSNNFNKSVSKKRVVIPSNQKLHNSKFIIKLGEDSDSAEEHEYSPKKNVISKSASDDDWTRRVVLEDNTRTFSALGKTGTPQELEKSVDFLLRQVRRKHEGEGSVSSLFKKRINKSLPSRTQIKISRPVRKEELKKDDKQDSLTPLAVRHLPKSLQDEYRRLKQKIIEKERMKQLKLKLNDKPQKEINSESVSKEICPGVQKVPAFEQCLADQNENCNSPNAVDINATNPFENCVQKNDSTCNSSSFERHEDLKELENNFVNERFNLLDSIVNTELTIRNYDKQSENYNSALKDVSRLREQLKEAELRLNNVSKELVAAKEDVACNFKLFDVNHVKYSHKEKCCSDLGNQIMGTNYKLPKVAADIISRKLGELLNFKKAYSKRLHLEEENYCVTSFSINESVSPQSNVHKRSLKEVSHSTNIQSQMKRIKQNNDNSTTILKTTADDKVNSLPLSIIPENQLLPYVSPLAHMQGGLSRKPVPAGGKLNHDGILCPYALRGSCMDDSCPYEH